MSKRDHGDIIQIEIYDQRYPLRLSASTARQEIEKLAEEVDLRMREIAQHTGTVDTLKVAILTALHLAEEKRGQDQGSRRLDAAVRAGAEKWIKEIDRTLAEGPSA